MVHKYLMLMFSDGYLFFFQWFLNAGGGLWLRNEETDFGDEAIGKTSSLATGRISLSNRYAFVLSTGAPIGTLEKICVH